MNSVTNSETCSDSGMLSDGTPVDCAAEFPWTDAARANSMCINNPCTEAQRQWNEAKRDGITGAVHNGISGRNGFTTLGTAAECAKQAACARTCDTCHVSTLDVTASLRVYEPQAGARRSLVDLDVGDHRDHAEATKNDCEYFANQANHQAEWKSTGGFLQLIELNSNTGGMLLPGVRQPTATSYTYPAGGGQPSTTRPRRTASCRQT